MRFIITGALGHIGSYLIRSLPSQFPDVEIVMIDNLMTQRYASLFSLPPLAHYRFIEADVRKANVRDLIKGADVVVHLAAITDAAASFDHAERVESNNYECTEEVARACAAVDVALIALSSTSVYGTQSSVVDEDCTEEELKPQSPYASTKLREERLIKKLCAEDGLRAICCRFGTIFGASPGMRFHTAVNKFCWQAAMGQPITVWSTAFDQKRPYLDLFDAGRAVEFIIRKGLFDGRIYNVVTLNATVRQIVDTIREFERDLEVKFVDSKIMNQLSYEVSRERFASLGFQFSGDLRRGVGDTFRLLRSANSGAT